MPQQLEYPIAKLLYTPLSPTQVDDIFHALPDQGWQPHVNASVYSGNWDVLPLRCLTEHSEAHPVLQCFNHHTGQVAHSQITHNYDVVGSLDKPTCHAIYATFVSHIGWLKLPTKICSIHEATPFFEHSSSS